MNARQTIIARIAAVCVGVALVVLVAGVVDRVLVGTDRDAGYAEALVAAHTRKMKAQDSALAVQRPAVTRTKIVYVTARRSAREAVEALPPATILADSITLPSGTYEIAPSVAQYVGQLQDALAKAMIALAAADSALAAQSGLVETLEARIATADSITAIVAPKRGVLSRIGAALKTPALLLSGAAVGYVVARVVP